MSSDVSSEEQPAPWAQGLVGLAGNAVLPHMFRVEDYVTPDMLAGSNKGKGSGKGKPHAPSQGDFDQRRI